MAPVTGQRAVRFLVEPAQAGVFKTVRARLGPAWGDRIGEHPLTGELGMRAVAAVVNDAAPVDEFFTCPGGRHAQCVRLEHHKFVALRHAARPLVEPDRDALVGDVARADLDRGAEVWPVVHVDVRLTGQLDVFRLAKRGKGNGGRKGQVR